MRTATALITSSQRFLTSSGEVRGSTIPPHSADSAVRISRLGRFRSLHSFTHCLANFSTFIPICPPSQSSTFASVALPRLLLLSPQTHDELFQLSPESA